MGREKSCFINYCSESNLCHFQSPHYFLNLQRTFFVPIEPVRRQRRQRVDLRRPARKPVPKPDPGPDLSRTTDTWPGKSLPQSDSGRPRSVWSSEIEPEPGDRHHRGGECSTSGVPSRQFRIWLLVKVSLIWRIISQFHIKVEAENLLQKGAGIRPWIIGSCLFLILEGEGSYFSLIVELLQLDPSNGPLSICTSYVGSSSTKLRSAFSM